VYFATNYNTYCIGLPNAPSAPAPTPDTTKAKAGAPTQLQIIPCDVVLQPGQSVECKVKAFDADGNFVQDVTEGGTWTLPQPPLPPGAKSQPPALQGEVTTQTKPGTLGRRQGARGPTRIRGIRMEGD